MSRSYISKGHSINIYGLEGNKNDWLASQLQTLIDESPETVDGLSIEPKGVSKEMRIVVELHGCMTPSQLRELADALENTPNK